jgi:selenocysteine lyase/cysteine desulfurase
MAHPDFINASGYLNTASIGLPPGPVIKAMQTAVGEWARGDATAPGYDTYVTQARDVWARMHQVDPADVAIGPQVSYFAGLVAQSLPRGAHVLSYDGDFASLVYPFLARGDLDVRLVPLQDVADSVGPETDVVAVSAVQSSDGRVADLDAIERAAAASGALTVIDATQGLGWLPLDASRFDFVIAATYKWLLSPRGTALMSIRPGLLESLPPVAAGWYSADLPWDRVYGAPLRLASDARRLDMSPAWLSWVGTLAALEYLSGAGIEAIHAHDVGLANALRAELGMPPGNSAMVSLERPGAGEALAEAGLRAGGLTDAVRIGFHLYNDEDDVDAVLRALSAVASAS